MNTARQWINRIAGRLRIQRIIWDLNTGDIHLYFLITEENGPQGGLTNPLFSKQLWKRALGDLRFLTKIEKEFTWKVGDLFRVTATTIADGVCMVASFRSEMKLGAEDAKKMGNYCVWFYPKDIKLSFADDEEIITNPEPAKQTMLG